MCVRREVVGSVAPIRGRDRIDPFGFKFGKIFGRKRRSFGRGEFRCERALVEPLACALGRDGFDGVSESGLNEPVALLGALTIGQEDLGGVGKVFENRFVDFEPISERVTYRNVFACVIDRVRKEVLPRECTVAWATRQPSTAPGTVIADSGPLSGSSSYSA